MHRSSDKPIAMQIEPLVSSHRWTIKNFASVLDQRRVAPGFHVTSPKLLTSWYLRLFPYSDDRASAEYMSLFAYQADKDEVRATVKLSIVNGRSEKVCERQVNEVFRRNEDWGYRKFIKRSVVTNREFGVLDDGDLTVQCELLLDDRYAILKTERESSACAANASVVDNVVVSPTSFDGFEKLLDDERFSDISFVVEERQVKAHRNILSLRSPVFDAMIARGDDMRKKGRRPSIVIRIRNVGYDVFRELLRFLYAGKVRGLREIAGDLLLAADKYAVDDLRRVCEAALCDGLARENALQRLALADERKLASLRSSAIRFVAGRVNEFVRLPEFKSLRFELVCDVIREIANDRALKNKLANK